jgi:hypothetical protein
VLDDFSRYVIALSREGFAQSIERQVLAEFRLQNGGEEMRPGPAAHDRVKGRGRLSDGLTTAAGEFLPHCLGDFPLSRDDFHRFGHMNSLIQAAKLNGDDPCAWLADVLTRIAVLPQLRLHELLPCNWKKQQNMVPGTA